MKNNEYAVLLFSAALLSGCAQMSPMPLVFVSTNTLGVDIGTDPSSAQTPRLVLGYKTTDVAIVPVTTELNQGPAIRGCNSTLKNQSAVATCADSSGSSQSKEGMAQPTPPSTGSKPVIKSTFQNGDTPAWREASLLKIGLPDGSQRPADTPNQRGVDIAQINPGIMAIPLDNGPTAKPKPKPADKSKDSAAPKAIPQDDGPSSYSQSIHDSLSVFSSFNADAKVGAEGGVQLGKAFATGVAAQQLTEGINYYMQRKGQALASGVMSETNKDLLLRNECVKSLIAAKEKQVPNELLPNCNEKHQQSQDELNAKTACVQALTVATEKKVPADKLPKCG